MSAAAGEQAVVTGMLLVAAVAVAAIWAVAVQDQPTIAPEPRRAVAGPIWGDRAALGRTEMERRVVAAQAVMAVVPMEGTEEQAAQA